MAPGPGAPYHHRDTMRPSPVHPAGRPRPPRGRLTAVLALLLASAVAGVRAAPLPPTHPSRPLAPLAPAVAPSASEAACGTLVAALPDALAAQAEARAVLGNVPLPTPHSTDIGEIAVIEDDGTLFFTDKGGNVNLDVAAAGRAFYRTHGDDYDQVAFFLTSGLRNWLGSATALAAAWPTRNQVEGLGLSLFDFNRDLGLPPRVSTILTMNGLDLYPDDPGGEVVGLPNYVRQDVLAHEFGHQWLAYTWVNDPAQGGPTPALLGRAFQHWSFFYDAEGSFMEGADWQTVEPDSFVMADPIARFGPFDQYLMGLRDRSELDSLLVVSDTARFVPNENFVTFSNPMNGITAKGPSLRFGIEDVEFANGPRLPVAAESPHTVRVAFALIVPRGTDASPADLAKLEAIRAAFPATIAAATGGRMTLDASLDSRAGSLRLVHRGLSDTENDTQPRTIGLRVSEQPAGIPVHANPDGVTLWYRTDPQQLWSQLRMNAVAADSFAVTLPPQTVGTRLDYWFRAESDSAGIRTDMPVLPRSRAFGYTTGPDTIPPRIEHWAVHEQSADRLPQPLLARVTDNLGLDSVWCEYAINEGPLSRLDAVSAGGDSFLVALGAGLPHGSRIAYRFVARDASAQGNLGYSNPAFDTLRVGFDTIDQFWNPSPWLHGNVRFNRRDEWHLVTTTASPSGSGAWHCGSDSLPYGPYQDAALTSALVYGITPGTTLTFQHRYDLEDAGGGAAFDGMRVEAQAFNGTWDPIDPEAGYTHMLSGTDQGLPNGALCWSGRQDAWREERFDLSAYAPGPVRVRLRMSTDLFVGRGGWWVDDIRFHIPGAPVLGVDPGAARVTLGPLWPQPSPGALRQALRVGAACEADWSLYDLAGRRVATLWRGRLTGGAHELSGEAPRSLRGGLYFARLTLDGVAQPARRVAIVR